MIAILRANQRGSQLDVLLRFVPILEEIVRRGAAAGQVGACRQPPVLGLLRQCDGFVCMLSRKVCVQGQVGIFELLFHPAVLSCSLEYACAGHKNMVVLLLSQFVGFDRFLRSSIDFALIKMELAGVYQHSSGSAMVLMMRVNLA